MTRIDHLWRRAIVNRARAKALANRGAAARLALAAILARCGHRVSLVSIRTWPRHAQGAAYLWAVAFLAGREDVPAPPFVVEAARAA